MTNLEIYSELKSYFMNNLQSSNLPCEFLFKEDKDNLALHFAVKDKDRVLDYYYCFGDFAIHRFENEKKEVLISKNPENFVKIISRNIKEIINNTEVI